MRDYPTLHLNTKVKEQCFCCCSTKFYNCVYTSLISSTPSITHMLKWVSTCYPEEYNFTRVQSDCRKNGGIGIG